MTALPFRQPHQPKPAVRVVRARCRACGDIIETPGRRDFRACACGAIALDGEDPRVQGDEAFIELLPDGGAEDA